MASTSDVTQASSSAEGEPSTSNEEERREMDTEGQFELLHAIERFLEGGQFGRAAAALRREINERKLVPSRTDFEGGTHERNYRQFLSALSDLPSTSRVTAESLPEMISRLSTLTDSAVAPPVKGLKLRLITNRRSALQRTKAVLAPPRSAQLMHGRGGSLAMLKTEHSPIEFLRSRELGARIPLSRLPGEKSVELIERHFRILGHLANVFCLAFDRNENYLITGADDNLVKVWHIDRALLKFTYRGHSAEIADLSVSFCNQLVASGSIDKTIRVWRLQNGETLSVFRHHTAAVTCVKFLPYCGNGNMRYLVTTGNDCIVNFYMFNQETLEFPCRDGIVYHRYERDQPGAKMVSLCHSPSGHVVAIGETHGVIRVYRMHEGGLVEKMNDITAHTDRVDSLVWAHNGLQFVSGSKDGTAKIWRLQYGEWEQTTLQLTQAELIQICGASVVAQNNPNSKNKYKVSMVCWTLDDERLVTTGSDHSFRVWDAKSGQQLLKLSAHTDDAYHLCAHPVHAHLVLSAGHDGLIGMWDVIKGRLVQKWMNTVEGGENAAVYDVNLTRDATRFAITDINGHVSMYGLGTNSKAKKMPKQQFFNTDYHPIVLDDGGWALDEQTGVAPHLMPPPRMINVELEEYGEEIQRMVPGRDLEGEIDEDNLICPWIERDIVPKMDEHELKVWSDRLAALGQQESESFNRELVRERPRTPTVEVMVPMSRRGNARVTSSLAAAQARSLENRRYRASYAVAMADMRREISMRYIGMGGGGGGGEVEVRRGPAARRLPPPQPSNDDEEEGEEEGEEEEEEEGETTDTSDSDYESEDRRRERREREREDREREAAYSSQGTTSRPRRREREVEVEIEDEMDESSQQSRGRRERRRRGEVDDDFGNDLSIDMHDLPSTSTGRRRRERREEEEEEEEEREERPERERRRRAPREERSNEEEEEEEREEIVQAEERPAVRRQPSARDAWRFTFPGWMREVKRKRFPYVAQLGDHVVYFRQGHEAYLSVVEQTKLYYVDGKMRPKPEIGMEEFAIVDDIKYVMRPYRLTQLKLARTDSEGRRTGLTWTVKHHDLDNVPDFIILRIFYDEGLNMTLDMGDEIEAAIDDQWWSGSVETVNRNDSYPNAHWQSVVVRWDTGEDEALSPWDVRRKGPGRRSGPVSEEEFSSLSYTRPLEGDWPEGDESGEAIRRRIKRALTTLAGCETVAVFQNPVALEDYVDYPEKVAYPMDLQTICERIDNQYYRRLRSLLQDIRYIAISAESYNLKESDIVRNAKVLVEAVVRYVNDPSIEDIVSFFDSCYDIPAAELVEYKRKSRAEVNSEMLSLLQEDESGGKGEEERERLPGWIREATEIMMELQVQPCARHFLVKDEEHEELATVWETCDDLQTLTERVKKCEMSTPKELDQAIISLVQTVRSVIDNKRNEIYKDSTTLQSFFANKFRGILSKFESMQASVSAQLGVSLDRSLRRRMRDAPHHSYNTRRADHSAALTAAALAAAAAEYDEMQQPSTSSAAAATTRSAARHESGYYRSMMNGGRGRGRASEETEVSSSSSGRRRSSRRGGGRVIIEDDDEEEEEAPPPPPPPRRENRVRRAIVEEEEEEDGEGGEEENGEEEVDDARAGLGEEEEEEDEYEESDKEEEKEEEEEAVSSPEEEEEEEYRTRGGRAVRNGGRKRKMDEEEEEEEEERGNASSSTSSSIKRSSRKRKRRAYSSEEEEEEEDERPKRKRGAAAAAGGGGRPVRAAARQAQRAIEQESDEEEEVVRTSISSRGRQRRLRVYNE